MECINKFMHLSSHINANIHKSFCKTNQDDNYIYLTFGLYAYDCLFDLADNNYEFNIVIAKPYIEKYNEPIDLNITEQSICCNTQSKLLDIIKCKLSGIYRKIFLESTILFLFYQSQKNNFIIHFDCDHCAILNKPLEVEKIQKAKTFIINNLGNTLTIPIIATNVGTNQCYLKKGFKEVFKQTIFEFIQENRMVKAKHLLQSANPNITEISYRVGYSSLSSFSQSYKNFFGITPTEQIKQVFPNN